MIKLLYTFIFAAFLNACNGVGDGCFRGACFGSSGVEEDFDIDDLHYQGDPIKFACISEASQNHFDITDVYEQVPSDLVNSLKNGKGLSLLFYGVSSMGNYLSTSTYDSLFQFVKEWSQKSRTNVCMVFYGYATKSSQVQKLYGVINKMVKTQRFEYVAKMARDLVLAVGISLSQVDLTGFCFGAHIAGRTGQYLTRRTRNRVRLLLLLDPIKVSAFGSKFKESIKKWDADYVQVIHTSKLVGIWDQIGDVDIYVKYEKQKDLSDSLNNLHGLAFFIHIVTSTKRLFIWAEERGTGSVRKHNGTDLSLDDECLVGVYDTLTPTHRGKKFNLDLKGDYVKRLREANSCSFNTDQSYDVEEEDQICFICCRNEINAKLGCKCTKASVCMDCWKTWKNQPNCHNLCPVCKQNVTSVELV